MAKFLVSAEMAPGVARHSVGFFPPGQILSWPDAVCRGEKPSLRLIPVDQEAYDLLVSSYGAAKVEEAHGKEPVGMPTPAPKVDDTMTLAQAAEKAGLHPKKRAADR